MQLTAENIQKPVSTDMAANSAHQNAAILDMGDSEEQVKGGVVSEEQEKQEELSSLFSGMAVSGEKAPRPSRPTQPVQPVRRVRPSPPSSRAKKQQEESSAFGDLLGLV